jgi:hypothetical protein
VDTQDHTGCEHEKRRTDMREINPRSNTTFGKYPYGVLLEKICYDAALRLKNLRSGTWCINSNIF